MFTTEHVGVTCGVPCDAVPSFKNCNKQGKKKAEEALMKGDGKSVSAFCFLAYCSEEEQHNCYHIQSLDMEGI